MYFCLLTRGCGEPLSVEVTTRCTPLRICVNIKKNKRWKQIRIRREREIAQPDYKIEGRRAAFAEKGSKI